MSNLRNYTLKEKIKLYNHCQKYGKGATIRKYNVSRTSLIRWEKKVKKGGAPLTTLLARKPKRHTVCEEAIAAVRKLHAKHPELSLETLRKKVSHIQHISRTTVWKVVSKNYK